jgi:hypothetical protein
VPPAESMSIAASLEQAGHSLYFSSFDILQHVEPGSAYPPLTLAGDGRCPRCESTRRSADPRPADRAQCYN